jgi:hypothetical protein
MPDIFFADTEWNRKMVPEELEKQKVCYKVSFKRIR